jgi:hypothetical protein
MENNILTKLEYEHLINKFKSQKVRRNNMKTEGHCSHMPNKKLKII